MDLIDLPNRQPSTKLLPKYPKNIQANPKPKACPILDFQWSDGMTINKLQTKKLGKFSNTKTPEKHVKLFGEHRGKPWNSWGHPKSPSHHHFLGGKLTARPWNMEILSAQPHPTGGERILLTSSPVVRSNFNWTCECKLNVSYLTLPKDPEIEDWTLLFLL